MAETKREIRIKQLAELLIGREKVHLKAAADSLNVSEMTIRRDFTEPNELVSLIGGYVVRKQGRSQNSGYFLDEQSANHVEEKKQIGQKAAQHVLENQTVFFDNGTSIVHIIQAIDDKIPFIGVCFSMNIFVALKRKPNCQVVLCGGAYDPKFNNFYPLSEQSEIDNIRFDTVFISAAGVDPEQGITCYSFNELPYKRKAIKQTASVVLAADHSKLGVVKSAFVCPLSAVHHFISDKVLPPEYLIK